MNIVRRSARWIVLLLIALAAGGGCGSSGPELAAIRGRVLMDGEPLEHGAISFIPTGATKGPAAGSEIVNGTYAIERARGPVLGSHRVEVRGHRKTGRKLPAIPPAPAGTEIDEVIDISANLDQSASSLLTEVHSGDNIFDVELKSK